MIVALPGLFSYLFGGVSLDIFTDRGQKDRSMCASYIYMFTIRLPERTGLAKTLNQYHAKFMQVSKMQLVLNCYTAVLFEPISRHYIYQNLAVYISLRLYGYVFFFVFLQDKGIEKPAYRANIRLHHEFENRKT